MNERWQARVAAVTGFAVVAAFVAGKTARDAMFLSSFRVTSLPAFAAIGAIITIPLVLVVARSMTRVGPARLVPRLFAGSAVLLVVEWLASSTLPRIAAATAYLHLGALGPILVSGFWSTISERFDPRAAKRNIARIGLGATLGGIAGGLVAQGTAAWLPLQTILLVVAVLQVACVVLLRAVGRRQEAPSEEAGDVWEGMRVVAHSPLLRAMAVLAILGAMGAAALDYAFKAQLAASDNGVLGTLGMFYAITNVVTALVQVVFTSRAIVRIGVGRSAAIWPGVLALFSISALAAPVMLVISVARSAEMVAHSSVSRASSELLMNPLAPRDKRSAKVIMDVGADRIGDMLGAQLVGVLLLVRPSGVLASAVIVSLTAFVVALHIPRRYRHALERRLVAAAESSTPAPTESSLLPPVIEALRPPVIDQARDNVLAAIADLRSGDRARIERRLTEEPIPELAPHLVPLVAWSPVAEKVTTRLRDLAPRATGLLVDALLDPETEFGIRRKLPGIIAAGNPALAVIGLWGALSDPRFEVRYRAGKALARIRDAGHPVPATSSDVFDAIEREVRVDTRIWRNYRLVDGLDTSDDPLLFRVLEQRSSTALDHVFTLLGLVLPADVLRICLQALSTNDRDVRGTALEYLEGVLPPRIREGLWPFLELDPNEPAIKRPARDLVSELKLSHPSILANLRRAT